MDCCYFTIRLVLFLLLVLLVAAGHSTASSSAYSVAGKSENRNDAKGPGLSKELPCSGETMMEGRKMRAAGKCECGGRKKGKAESVPGVKLFGHAPFTSDYRGPKTHPPKNN